MYTFEFTIISGNEQRAFIKKAPLSQLLATFDEALQWKRESAEGESRFASIYGPNIQRCVVDELTRRRIVRIIPTPKPVVEVVGIVWADFVGPEDRTRMSMQKVIRTTEYQVDGAPEIGYRLELVEVAKHDLAFDWIKAHFWRDWGIWFRGKPGIVFTPDFQAVEAAFLSMPETARHLELDRLVRAPVRYDWTKMDPPLYVKSTRDRCKIQALRSRFPTASEDMMYTPLDILIHRYGYGMQAGMESSEAPCLAAG